MLPPPDRWVSWLSVKTSARLLGSQPLWLPRPCRLASCPPLNALPIVVPYRNSSRSPLPAYWPGWTGSPAPKMTSW
jgi:hypothetical protein